MEPCGAGVRKDPCNVGLDDSLKSRVFSLSSCLCRMLWVSHPSRPSIYHGIFILHLPLHLSTFNLNNYNDYDMSSKLIS